MSNLVFRLPRYYQDSPQVSELERVLGEQAGALRVSESDTLAQLWIDTATWGLDLWEQWAGLPVDRTRPYSYRRGRIKAKLRGQGATTAEMLRSVVVLPAPLAPMRETISPSFTVMDTPFSAWTAP